MEPIELQQPNNSIFATRTEAQVVYRQGSPRRADVRAASNALYLATIGKAGGLNIEKAVATVAKSKAWQAARRFLGL